MLRLLPAVSVIPILCVKVFKKVFENPKMMKRYVVAFAGSKSCIGSNQGHRQGMLRITSDGATATAAAAAARSAMFIVLITK